MKMAAYWHCHAQVILGDGHLGNAFPRPHWRVAIRVPRISCWAATYRLTMAHYLLLRHIYEGALAHVARGFMPLTIFDKRVIFAFRLREFHLLAYFCRALTSRHTRTTAPTRACYHVTNAHDIFATMVRAFASIAYKFPFVLS